MHQHSQAGTIEFDRVTKRYPGATAPAVDDLTLRVEAGEICALVGPSGSGKTTAMRMINRLHEPTSGDIRIDGRSTRSMEPEQLRRGIGYVIQQVGLFPHRSINDNVATVPRLLGWDEARVAHRTRELLDLVGLDPSIFGSRYPSQLSGGQRQRVGVARALAADPPVLLMDEPFGAIDPVMRGQIQDEFLRLQRQVRKTIVIVTHDLDEAIKMGDRVAVLQEGGILAGFGTPEQLLAAPPNDFVRDFLGSGTAIKRLALRTVATCGGVLDLGTAARGGNVLYVDADGRPVHWGASGAPASPSIAIDATLADALDAILASGAWVAPVVDHHGRAIGVLGVDAIQAALRSTTANEQVVPTMTGEHYPTPHSAITPSRSEYVHPAALRPPLTAVQAG